MGDLIHEMAGEPLLDFVVGEGNEPRPDEESDDAVSAEIVLADDDFPLLSLLLVVGILVGVVLGDLERFDRKNFAILLDLLLLGDFANISDDGICSGSGDVGEEYLFDKSPLFNISVLSFELSAVVVEVFEVCDVRLAVIGLLNDPLLLQLRPFILLLLLLLLG